MAVEQLAESVVRLEALPPSPMRDYMVKYGRALVRELLVQTVIDAAFIVARLAYGPALWDAGARIDHDPGDEDADP